ncbi:hypothetical protein F2P81_013219 [Scophthalmus maximus]|uniref:ribonuclease H n=1 Tax=Scophthalmus maximus TaxID=52904 RepID=A0A6A4SWT2_SCOMX|nr:hypothetical protein F2P81_013219 [Scophthalmus maximus]
MEKNQKKWFTSFRHLCGERQGMLSAAPPSDSHGNHGNIGNGRTRAVDFDRVQASSVDQSNGSWDSSKLEISSECEPAVGKCWVRKWLVLANADWAVFLCAAVAGSSSAWSGSAAVDSKKKLFLGTQILQLECVKNRADRSTKDAICSAIHPALTHRDTKNSYVRMMFIDFSSAFNTIIMDQLGLSTSLCNWLLDFLSERPQVVRVCSNTSRTTILSTWPPQGFVLSPLLFMLLTHDCTPSFSSNHIVKFVDDTTVVGLISNSDETHYRKEVSQLTTWCRDNNLFLNIDKTKDVAIDFRRGHTHKPPLTINGAAVERVSSTKFLGCTSVRTSPGQ